MVYGCYGLRNSSEEYKQKGLKPPEQETMKQIVGDLKLDKFGKQQQQDRNSNYFDDFE